MARLILNQGESVGVNSGNFHVFGTQTGVETVTIGAGSNVSLDASFNAGGDIIDLPGLAAEYTVHRSGSSVILTNGTTTVSIPAGTAGATVQFDDAARELVVQGSTFLLGGQTIGVSASPVTPGSGGNPALYDVTVSSPQVTENDSGTQMLTFTITLDRPATSSVTVNYTTSDGTATAGSDYTTTAGMVTFVAGQQVATVSVPVLGDSTNEVDETVNLTVTGMQIDGDGDGTAGDGVSGVGLIIDNEDSTVTLTAGQDVVGGSNEVVGDEVVAFNSTLNAGDKITGQGGGEDVLRVFTDGNLAGSGAYNYAGFELNGVERLEVTNDSDRSVAFDLSGATGLQTVATNNSSSSVAFNQLASSAITVELNNLTDVNDADVTVQFQNAAVAGADTVNLVVKNTDVDVVTIGRVGDLNGGVETVNVQAVGGQTTIQDLDTDLSTLNVSGDNDLTIVNALNNTISVINITGAGDVSLNTGDNDVVGVDVNAGSATGAISLTNGDGADSIVTGSGGDTLYSAGGNDTISAGAGFNFVSAGDGHDVVTTGDDNDGIELGAGNDSVESGGGNDGISAGAGADTIRSGAGDDQVLFGANFDASVAVGNDVVDFGDGDDTIFVNAGAVDAQFANVSNLEHLVLMSAGTTVLEGYGAGAVGKEAQESGIERITADWNYSGDDVIDADDFTSDLEVTIFGGNDTIVTGVGADTFNVLYDGNLTDADQLSGGVGAANDKLNLRGDTTITTASLFSDFETINLASGHAFDGTGHQYVFALDDDNRPWTGPLVIDGAGLKAASAGLLTAETVTYDGSMVTTYSVIITTGGANDTLTSGVREDHITSGAGNDLIVAGGGNDTIFSGEGVDTVNLSSGNNYLEAGAGADKVTLGTGNDEVLAGAGADTITAAANLGAADTVDGGTETDVLVISGLNYGDAAFTNVSNVEVLHASSGFTSTLAAQAQEAGIRTVVSIGGAADTINAAGYTADLTVDISDGGADIVATGSGKDTVLLGTGDQSVTLNDGNDTVVVEGSELTDADSIAGGAGADTVRLNNAGGAVTAVVDLTDVTSVESYVFADDGDRLPGVDADANSLTFKNGSIGTLTAVTVDATALTDTADSLTVTLDATLTDADYKFTVKGGSTTTRVIKENVGTNNNIDFQGGSGADLLQIDGDDLGATVTMVGGAGTDSIIQTGGTLTDDAFLNVEGVEILTATVGNLDAILGGTAAGAGLTTVVGTTGDDVLEIDAAYTKALQVDLNTGDDKVTSASSAALTITATDAQVTAADTLSGGTGADELRLTASGGTADLSGVTNVELVTIVDLTAATNSNGTTVTLSAATTGGTNGSMRIDASALDSAEVFTLNGGTATVRLDVASGAAADAITTGALADTIVSGNGNDTIVAGAGNNHVTAGEGADSITSLGGNDTIIAGGGNDVIDAGGGTNTVDAGDGNDLVVTGAGADAITAGNGSDTVTAAGGADTITLTEGVAGVDTLIYTALSDSGATGRDTVIGFGATDVIDVRAIAELNGVYDDDVDVINFAGNANGFGEAQGMIVENDDILDIVFDTSTNTLWVDVNDDGSLNGNDLQIVLQGVDAINGSNVLEGSVVNFA